MTRRQKILLYLYSRRNIAGSLLGILGIVLFLTNVIQGPWVIFIIPGLYLIGALAVPESPRLSLQFRNQITAAEIQAELNRLQRQIRRRVPKEVFASFSSIKQSIEEILPYIVDINSADPHIFNIRQTALVYLPTALENYLNLPAAYASYHPVQGSKTARALLAEQLAILEREMKQIAIDFHKNDTQRLIAHGRFLEEKFRETEDWLN